MFRERERERERQREIVGVDSRAVTVRSLVLPCSVVFRRCISFAFAFWFMGECI